MKVQGIEKKSARSIKSHRHESSMCVHTESEGQMCRDSRGSGNWNRFKRTAQIHKVYIIVFLSAPLNKP